MIEKILLRIAYWINNYYNTIEIDMNTTIKYKMSNDYFHITQITNTRNLFGVSELNIECKANNNQFTYSESN